MREKKMQMKVSRVFQELDHQSAEGEWSLPWCICLRVWVGRKACWWGLLSEGDV